MDRTLCFDNSNEISGLCQVPESYILVFVALSANATTFFDIAVVDARKFEFDFKSVKILSIGTAAQRVDLSYFRAERSQKSFKNISFEIVKPIKGPQDIQVDLWIKLSGKTRIEDGIIGAKFFIVAS